MAQVNPRRTEEELNNPNYNYFIAFKIDANENDVAKINDTVNAALRTTSGTVESRRLNELRNDCLEIMCNDAVYENGNYVQNRGGRKTEANRAVTFKKKEARGIIETLCRTRKTLLKSDILDICDKANKPVSYFTEDEFLKEILPYLSGLGVKVIENMDTKIPFNDFQRIEKQLEVIGKKDLYDFLEVNKTASVDEIKTASDIKYRESIKIIDLKKKQSTSSICSNAKKMLLTDSETKKAYDQYLILKKDVWDEFFKRKSFGIKELFIDEYNAYIQTVINLLKVSADESEKIIAIGCKYFQFTIVGKTERRTQRMFSFCPYCGKRLTMNEGDIFTFCPYCGETL